MKTRVAFLMSCGLGLCALAGCKSDSGSVGSTPSKSPIVARVEAAGSGDLESLDTSAIQDWLSKHQEVAKSVSPACGTASKNAAAAWSVSTEGRVCTATAHVMFFAPKDLYSGYGKAPKS